MPILQCGKGEWNKNAYAKGFELAGKTLGVVGFGRIGKSLARMATALRMNIMAHDSYLSESGMDGVSLFSLDDVLAKSDIVSLHIPGSEKPVIGKDELAKMKDGAVLINCARGGVVDEDALCDALDSGKLFGAGIDVFAKEPTDNTRLTTHPKVSITPHIGATTVEAQDRVGGEVVLIIQEFFK
jgi:D-3-phosphoglycerate dehydrogenase